MAEDDTITITSEDEEIYHDESYLFPKECREISKNKTLPTEKEIRYIHEEYGIDINKRCRSLAIACISHQKLAWKAINYQYHTKEYLSESDVIHYKETWYNVNE